VQDLASSFLGLGNGGTYAALGLALVLTYRSSGVINFATGAQALYAGYTYAFLRQGKLFLIIPGLPTTVDIGHEFGMPGALVLTLIISALLGALLYVSVFRPLRNAPPLGKAVASLGVLVVMQGLMSNRMGTTPVSVEAIYPSERWTWQDMTLLSDRVYLAVTVLAMTFVITALYRWTRFGLDTRATAESETGAYVSGISPDRIALLNWMLAGAVAGAAGILIAPLAPVVPNTYTLFVVPALAAAIVGRFQYLVPTVIAGIAIGMIQAWLVYLSGKYSWMPASGVGEIVPLVVMLVALLVTGRAVPERGTLLRTHLGRAPRPRSYTVPIICGFAIGAVALFVTEGTARAHVIGTLIFAILALSLVVVTGYAGQVSLAQLALAGAGAFMLSYLSVDWGVPFPIAPLLAALAAAVVGVVVGLPALRLRGLTLGVVTLALAFGLEAIWFRNTDLVNSFGNTVENPKLFGLDLGVGVGEAFPRLEFGFMCLIVAVVVAFGVARLRTSSLGSAMLAVRANERSAAGIGINVTFVKVISFAIASFIAGIAGSLLAYRQGIITWESFAAIAGLALLSTAYLAGVTSVFGGVQAGIIAAGGIVFYLTDKWFDIGGDTFIIVSGVLLLVTLMLHPEGIASGGHELADRIAQRRHKSETAAEDEASAEEGGGVEPVPELVALPNPSARTAPGADAPALLEVEGLTVQYGGVVAVSDVSLKVPAGGIIGLIGPNGAGKTSAIDAITGFTKSDGAVWLDGSRIERLKSHQRVRRGLARTFQQLELYDDLTVEENVSAAAFGVKGEARRGAVQRALDLVGIANLRERDAGDLSQGQRQLVSIARACAADPKVILLDEPAAGLDTTESAWLGERIRNISAIGTGVLLIDHDVALVLSICDYIYVLDFGSVIAEGDPASIRANRAVADAYLGTVHDATAVTA
jgi:ABC-type branched-subunit amino acid transport system ATPase component/ABC-type branched-subunit amino acid transport system permease subunit